MTLKQRELGRLARVVEYIQAHTEVSLPLEHLAELAHMSVPTLHRKFKALFGITPKQFQNDQRIQTLKKALKQGHSVTEAVFIAGFGSVSRVYEQADAAFGMTLSEYQNQGKDLTISYMFGEISHGQLIIAATDKGVCFLHFGDDHQTLYASLQQEFPKATLIDNSHNRDEQLSLWLAALQQHITDNNNLCGHTIASYWLTFSTESMAIFNQNRDRPNSVLQAVSTRNW